MTQYICKFCKDILKTKDSKLYALFTKCACTTHCELDIKIKLIKKDLRKQKMYEIWNKYV